MLVKSLFKSNEITLFEDIQTAQYHKLEKVVLRELCSTCYKEIMLLGGFDRVQKITRQVSTKCNIYIKFVWIVYSLNTRS